MVIEGVIAEAIKLVTPTPEEEVKVYSIANKIVDLFKEGLLRKGYRDFEVSIQGSIAKGTWLPGDRDIDIFVILQRDYLERIRKGDVVNDLIDIASEAGLKWIVKYAQHPYIQILIDEYQVDIVPCIRISLGEKPLTAADRTPLHTAFVKSKLGDKTTDVRLLKAFFKSIGVYGAEIRVRGFSGYLAELLVIYYGSFLNAIRGIASWKKRPILIDLTGSYTEELAVKKFDAPLIVIDPVDPDRNAAAAVSVESMAIAIAASRAFLRNPRLEFFNWRTRRAVGPPNVITPTLIVELPYPKNVSPDIVWGEVWRVLDSIIRNLRAGSFVVYHATAWSDEESRILMMITLEQLELPPYELHEGPPITSEAAEAFIEKYKSDHRCIGPFIRGFRWYVIRPRKYPDAIDVVKRVFNLISVKHLKQSFKQARFYKVKSLDDLNVLDEVTRTVVLDFLIKRPWWV